MESLFNEFLKLDSSLSLSKKRQICGLLYGMLAITIMITASIIRLVILFYHSDYQYLAKDIVKNATDSFAMIVDFYIIGFVALLGLTFDSFNIKLQNLKNEKEKIFFYTLEVPYLRNK